MYDLLTKEELAEILKIKPRTIDSYLARGFVPTTKTPLRFTLEEFITWEQSTRTEKKEV